MKFKIKNISDHTFIIDHISNLLLTKTELTKNTKKLNSNIN